MKTSDFNIDDEFNNSETEIIEVNEICPSLGMFADLIMSDKPFGMVWNKEIQVDFLKKLGYKIIEIDKELDRALYVAVKPDSSIVPDMTIDNIDSVFSYELQKILVDWLIKEKNK